jgi:hypothetical protein
MAGLSLGVVFSTWRAGAAWTCAGLASGRGAGAAASTTSNVGAGSTTTSPGVLVGDGNGGACVCVGPGRRDGSGVIVGGTAVGVAASTLVAPATMIRVEDLRASRGCTTTSMLLVVAAVGLAGPATCAGSGRLNDES